MDTNYRHRDHFRKIAVRYRRLRTTDLEPIVYITRHLKCLPTIKAADIGCGTGRYTQLLFRHLPDNLSFMYGIDCSAKMLAQLKRHFAEDGIRAADMIKASAVRLPLMDQSLNCIFTFNAIHHFALVEFLREAARILQDGGYLFVYTRLRSQNSRSIWGSFFPFFASKETRLYELDELEAAITKIPSLKLRKARTFEYDRKSSLKSLIEKANGPLYSTFDLYSFDEFGIAVKQFRCNLRDHFADPNNIQWVDENILLVLQKAG